MKTAAFRCVAVFFALSQIASAEPPAAVWWSTPVRPGEIVLTHGGAWGQKPSVQCVALPNGEAGSPADAAAAIDFATAERLTPIKTTETGLSFTFPRNAPMGLVACRIMGEDGQASKPFILNELAAWWIQSDRGPSASPGGWIRVFGRCLSFDDRARLVLVGGNQPTELKLTKKDIWSLDAAVPDTLTPGTYDVCIHNGFGGRQGWRSAGKVTVEPAQEAWKTNRFDVTRFGAIPNDGLDDTAAIQAALAAAEKNGGGIVYLPRGRFQCNGTLRIPPRTLLRGASRDLTQLYWPDCENPPDAFIEGTRDFGIEDLFIQTGKYKNGIVCENAEQSKKTGVLDSVGSVTIRRIRLKLVIDQHILKNTAEYEKRAYLPGNGLMIHNGRFVRIEDCDIYASKEGSSTLFFVLTGNDYLRVANCRINGSGWALVSGDRVIYENNDAWNCTYSIGPAMRNLYWANNRQYDLFTNNRESLTHDVCCCAFGGIVPGVCNGDQLTLDLGKNNPYRQPSVFWIGRLPKDVKNSIAFWVGQTVQIVEGRGAGQFRTVTSVAGGTLKLDRPWDIAPDATSRYVLGTMREHLLYLDNYAEDSGVGIQLYGGATNSVVARNRCARTGGFIGFGMDYHGIIPLWFVQFLGNEVLDGNTYGNWPRDAVVQISDNGGKYTLTRSCVMRGNVIDGNGRINMSGENGLIENCVVKNADHGINVAGKSPASIVLHGNRFENVVAPLDAAAQQKAVLHPADLVSVMISGAATVLGDQAPAEWKAILADLAACARDRDIADPEAMTQSRQALVRALKALASQGDKVYDERVAQSLLGASLQLQPWHPTLIKMFTSGRAMRGEIPFSVGLAASAPAARCDVAFEEFSGWKFQTSPVSLEPAKISQGKVAISVPAGPIGYFHFPAVVTYSGDGWSLKFHTAVKTLTENRIYQWLVVGPFDVPKDAKRKVECMPIPNGPVDLTARCNTQLGPQSWVKATSVNDPHGALHFDTALGLKKPVKESAAVALCVLRVKRTMPVHFGFQVAGETQLIVDDACIGTNATSGGNVTLEPGDHLLKVVSVGPDKKGHKKDQWSIRLWMELPNASRPDDIQVVSPDEVLQKKTVSPFGK